MAEWRSLRRIVDRSGGEPESVRAATRGRELAVLEGLAESGPHPIVLTARVNAPEEVRERASPGIACSALARTRRNLPAGLVVFTANQSEGRARPRFGEYFVGSLLIGPDVPLMLAYGVDPTPQAFQRRVDA
jgi:hypothetical protein